jgi:hypothetical protein
MRDRKEWRDPEKVASMCQCGLCTLERVYESKVQALESKLAVAEAKIEALESDCPRCGTWHRPVCPPPPVCFDPAD